MIIDSQCNTVYFSSKLKEEPYTIDLTAILTVLKKHPEIIVKWLDGTKDIWARDYMPIQTDLDRYVSFRYEPSYLAGYEHLRTDRKEIPLFRKLNVIQTNINLDGGNVVKWKDKAIITDRVVVENPGIDKKVLYDQIGELLQCEVIVIRSYSKSEDMTGHADGMLRFIDANTIIGNNYDKDYDYMRNSINKILRDHNLSYVSLPFFDDPWNKQQKKAADRISARGIYVNYLEIANIILFPIFKVPGYEKQDDEAFNTILQVFPNRKVYPIKINNIAVKGGLMNCVSWSVRE